MKFRQVIAVAAIPILLSACQTTGEWNKFALEKKSTAVETKTDLGLASIGKDITDKSLVQQVVAEGLKALDEGNLEDASTLFNTALRFDISNSHLQFMNAYVYHLMGVNGDAANFKLAEQGYGLAAKFDKSNAAARYYKGLLYLDQRKYDLAQSELATAALMYNNDPEVLYDLAFASYYAGDPRTADAALSKIETFDSQFARKPEIQTAQVIAKAALNDTSSARGLLEEYRQDGTVLKASARLNNRIDAWDRFHDSVQNGEILLAQQIPSGVPTIPGANASETPAASANVTDAVGDDFVDDDMVVVDVVIIRTQEEVSTTKGLNLLSGLELQFGDPLTQTSGFSFSEDRTFGQGTTNNTSSTVSTLISLPAVNYSLNIFNTTSGNNEILARPSLVALSGERSEFFSGVDVIAAAVSGGDGSSVSINKQIGVKLSVVPEFLPDNRVRLEVEAERTFLTNPSSSVVFEFRLDTSKTTVNANVAMRFGETLILSGLTERDSEASRNQVPFLGDIPALQYLFARDAKRDFRRSVVILLTPRRAQYVNQSAEEREKVQAQLSEFEKSVYAFEQRNKNWFVPRSTFSDALAMAQNNSLFMEYRAGDFKMQKWNSRKTNEDRIKEAAEFLFY